MICLKDLNIKEVEKYINDDNFYFIQNGKRVRLFSKGSYLCKFANRSRKYGYRLTDKDLETIFTRRKKRKKTWESAWFDVFQSLKKWELWNDIQDNIELGLKLGKANIQKLYEIWDNWDLSQDEKDKKMKEITGGIKPNNFIYWNMNTMPTVKKMRFHQYRWERETTEEKLRAILEAFREKRAYSCFGYNGYDASFEYDGKTRAWYSEEYKGCGNGYYYIAISLTHALFMEKD